MRCERFREAVSARLDGEPLGMSASALDGHLSACPDCARWASAAAQATRAARLDVTPVPDLADAITAGIALPARRVLRRRHLLRTALVLAGLAQLAVGMPPLFGDSMDMVMTPHGAHENAAWNLAIGVAFLAAALVPRRATGLLPLLGTFTLVLGVLSVRDLASGAVGPGRLATHAVIVVGLVLLIALDRAERALPPSGASTGKRSPGDTEKPDLRGVA